MEAGPINKTMERADLERPEARPLIQELDELVRELHAKGLRVSSWYGGLDLAPACAGFRPSTVASATGRSRGPPMTSSSPGSSTREIAWILLNTPFEPGDRVLDMGGSSSLFSFLLASRGLSVTTVDLNATLVAHANRVAEAMSWDLRNEVMDMRGLDFDELFQRVTSVCVYEHIPASDRVEGESPRA